MRVILVLVFCAVFLLLCCYVFVVVVVVPTHVLLICNTPLSFKHTVNKHVSLFDIRSPRV